MWQCSLLRNLSQDGAECEPDLLVGSSLGQVETRRYTERGEQQHWQLLPQTDRWFAKARLYSIVKLVAFSNWIFIKVVASSRHFAFSSHLFGSRAVLPQNVSTGSIPPSWSCETFELLLVVPQVFHWNSFENATPSPACPENLQ